MGSRGTCARIAMPVDGVVVACGDLDVPLKLDRSRELAEALSRGSFRIVPGRAHLPYLEAPAEVAALIAALTPRAGRSRSGRRRRGRDP